MAVAAEVDCLIALASAAREHHYTRPLLTRDNVLRIKQGNVYTCSGFILTRAHPDHDSVLHSKRIAMQYVAQLRVFLGRGDRTALD